MPDGSAKYIRVDIADVHAINQNFSFLNIEITSNQIENGAFPGTCGTDKGNLLSGFDDEADIFEHIVIFLICEPHMTEFDTALDLNRNRRGRACNLRLYIQY